MPCPNSFAAATIREMVRAKQKAERCRKDRMLVGSFVALPVEDPREAAWVASDRKREDKTVPLCEDGRAQVAIPPVPW